MKTKYKVIKDRTRLGLYRLRLKRTFCGVGLTLAVCESETGYNCDLLSHWGEQYNLKLIDKAQE